jgi:hypothetical protein
MKAISITQQIDRQKMKILGAEAWLARARAGDIKRAPEAIEKARGDLEIDKAILSTLEWLERNYEAVKSAVAKGGAI